MADATSELDGLTSVASKMSINFWSGEVLHAHGSLHGWLDTNCLIKDLNGCNAMTIEAAFDYIRNWRSQGEDDRKAQFAGCLDNLLASPFGYRLFYSRSGFDSRHYLEKPGDCLPVDLIDEGTATRCIVILQVQEQARVPPLHRQPEPSRPQKSTILSPLQRPSHPFNDRPNRDLHEYPADVQFPQAQPIRTNQEGQRAHHSLLSSSQHAGLHYPQFMAHDGERRSGSASEIYSGSHTSYSSSSDQAPDAPSSAMQQPLPVHRYGTDYRQNVQSLPASFVRYEHVPGHYPPVLHAAEGSQLSESSESSYRSDHRQTRQPILATIEAPHSIYNSHQAVVHPEQRRHSGMLTGQPRSAPTGQQSLSASGALLTLAHSRPPNHASHGSTGLDDARRHGLPTPNPPTQNPWIALFGTHPQPLRGETTRVKAAVLEYLLNVVQFTRHLRDSGPWPWTILSLAYMIDLPKDTPRVVSEGLANELKVYPTTEFPDFLPYKDSPCHSLLQRHLKVLALVYILTWLNPKFAALMNERDNLKPLDVMFFTSHILDGCVKTSLSLEEFLWCLGWTGDAFVERWRSLRRSHVLANCPAFLVDNPPTWGGCFALMHRHV